MFAWKEKRHAEDQILKLAEVDARSDGANRRAISLVPMPPLKERHEIALSASLRYRQLLLSLEAKQSTCCLRIISPVKKSRSAILIYRGKVIGCVYGSKREEQQIFGQVAHQHAVDDLAQPKSIIDAYVLTEEIVLSAASLFHGICMHVPAGKPASQVYLEAVQRILENNSVGCVVISDNEGIALCMVYLFAGRIVGVYSFAEGWLESTFQSGLSLLHAHQGSQVMVSCLDAANESEAVQLCFSLTGLSENAPACQDYSRKEGRIMDFASAAEEYRTALQLTSLEVNGSAARRDSKRPPQFKAQKGMYCIAPEMF